MNLLHDDLALTADERSDLERLLVDEVTQGLGPAERRELEFLLDAASRDIGADSGAVRGSGGDLLEELHLLAAGAELALLETAIAASPAPPASVPATVEASLRELARDEAKRLSEGRVLAFDDARVYRAGLSPAWWVAAAAIFLAALAWWPRFQQGDDSGPPDVTVAANGDEVAPPSLDELADTLILDFQATEDASANGAAGTVLWNPARQAGELRITGLEANDPTDFVYQLWIFDAQRDERYPVDGGVFSVPASGSVTVPVTPAVPVDSATLFAVTVEPPGGVVVSSRERIALVAQPS